MRRASKILWMAIILPASLILSSCNPLEKDSKSNTLLTVEDLSGVDIAGNRAHFLHSDVLYADPTTGASSIFADTALATLRASLLDPKPFLGVSQYNDIVITRYVVSYSRSDGKNTQGKDVPYSFENSLTATVKVGSTTDINFIIVREVAKMEPPLINLVNQRAEGVLNVTAKVDFYGQDMVKNKVKATGYLTIYFSNYGN